MTENQAWRGGRPVIIVVDDDASERQAIGRLLGATGFKVELFETAEELLSAGTVTEAACLICDVHLPRLSGFALYEQLRHSGAMPPVIFITGSDEPLIRKQSERLGAVAHLVKPFSGELATGDQIRHR